MPWRLSPARPARHAGSIHDAVTCCKAPGRIRVPAQDVADAHHPAKRRLLVEQGLGAGAAQRHMRHVARGHAAGLVERLQPAGLADAISASQLASIWTVATMLCLRASLR